MEQKGLKTVNGDYYCGYGETGEGEKLIGILAHLDIVPAGSDWNSDPFRMVEKDGYLYGRGVSDDKGAAVASMYALKYLIGQVGELLATTTTVECIVAIVGITFIALNHFLLLFF
jgi:acetylornithine deacetylase/succinyl-diaminopimelate desuccinylase-like protein